MRKLYVFFSSIGIVLVSLSITQSSYAISDTLVISQVQSGNPLSAKNEFVEIYNNSPTDVDVTDWCLQYFSLSLVQNELECFTPDDDMTHIYLPGYSFTLATTSELLLSSPSMVGDLIFSYTLLDAGGYVRIIDVDDVEIDRIGWGISTPEIDLAPVAPAGKILSRKMTVNTNIMQDTDVNSEDFEAVTPRETYAYKSLYKVKDACINIKGFQKLPPDGYSVDDAGNCNPPPVDVCVNLDGLQTIIPNGYALDANGDCQVDICQNVEGLQLVLPDDMDVDSNGNCIAHDECLNLPDIQAVIPDGMVRDTDGSCKIKILPLQLTELLPNAVGADDGNEFIELYNPNDSDVDLVNYKLYTGNGYTHSYIFPEGSYIKSKQYAAFYNDDINFTLVNTTGSVRLQSVDGIFTDETPIYTNPDDGFAWALIGDVWQYTNQPTPGSVNLSSLIEVKVKTVPENHLEPCPDGQYRSIETNRCRLLAMPTTILTPCKDGQYRSEETNRCRNIASDISTLVACAEGQERNPATNRCRSITSAVLGASTLTPCKAGQERNPETNRCRNVASSMPKADYAPEQVASFSNSHILWWSLAGVGAVAIGYGIWEWRQEIAGLYKKAKLLIIHKKP